MTTVKVERDGRVAFVRFDRGDRANALSLGVMRELTDVARSFEMDAQLSAVILTGRADVFSMGFDLKDAETAALKDAPLSERRLAVQIGRRMCDAWASVEALTISAISGWCVGGGVALAASTDLRVMGAEAKIYAPEIERGLNMSWGSVPRLVNLVGPARAKRLLILAETLDARQSEAWGFADEIAESPFAAARALAARAAEMPPVPLRMIKGAVDAYAAALAQTASHADFDQFALAQLSGDHAEAVNAFFEGRAPDFKGD